MQKSLLLVLAVIVLVGGGYFYLKGGTSPEGAMSDTMPVPENNATEMVVEEKDGSMVGGDAMMPKEPVVIAYTDAGYEPKSVTIKKGETVRFVNNATSQGTWPASAVHPTHSVYPEKSEADCLGSSFDSCRDLKPGESWDFTFNTVGEWRYHDHSHPSKTGVVIVQ